MSDYVASTIKTYDAIAKNRASNYTEAFWNQFDGLFTRGESLRLFLKWIKQKSLGRNILVPGCGDGRHSRRIQAFGFDTVSFDLSSEMIKLAKAQDPEGEYRVMDLRHSYLGFSD